MSKRHGSIGGLWRIWEKTLAEGRDPYREQSVVLGGLALRLLHPIWPPSSSASQLPDQQNSWSSRSVSLQSFFSSSAVEKMLVLPFRNWVSSDLFSPRAQGWVIPPVIYEDLVRSPYPVTGGTTCRTEKTAAFRRWVTALLSVQDQLLQKHNFHRYHHFLCLSWHLIFCFLTLYFSLAQLALL